MAVQHQIITVGTTAIAVGATTDPNADYSQTLLLRNTGATDVVLGGSGVTATTGYVLPAGQALQPFPLASGDQLFAIAATTATLHVLRLGV